MQNHAFIKKNCQNGQFATLVVENQVKSSFGKGIALVIAALALAFACFCFTPQQAHAKSYEMPHTTINATVQPNGDLHVAHLISVVLLRLYGGTSIACLLAPTSRSTA